MKQQKIKKQAFLEKISKELKEKEKQTVLNKKQATANALSSGNIEEFLKMDSVDDESAAQAKK